MSSRPSRGRPGGFTTGAAVAPSRLSGDAPSSGLAGVGPKGAAPHFGKIELVPQRLIPPAYGTGLEKAGIRLCTRQVLLYERVNDILRPGAKRGAVAQQIVGTFRARIERRARYGKDLPPFFGGEFRGDERAGPARRLDDDDRPAKTRDNPVAAGKVASPRFPAERHFADRRALFEEPLKQGFMFGRIDIPKPPATTAIVRSRSPPDAPARRSRGRGQRQSHARRGQFRA
jgi:hypothetical protein